MNNAELSIIKNAIKSIESKVFRDYTELENLQNSTAILKFSSMTVEKLKQDLFDYLFKARPDYNITIKDGKEYKPEKQTNNSIYVNCISGLKNFVHSMPYFATIISVKKENKINCAIVNNFATQEMFIAEAGNGAFLNGKRIRVSNKNNLKSVMISIKYDVDKARFIKIIENMNLTFKINNCAILDACNCACGKLDGGIVLEGNTAELEVAELFIVEAGGLFENSRESKTDCLFSNSLIHNEIKKLLDY